MGLVQPAISFKPNNETDFWLFLLTADSNGNLHPKFRLSGSTRPKLMLLRMHVYTRGGTRKYLKAQETAVELIAAEGRQTQSRELGVKWHQVKDMQRNSSISYFLQYSGKEDFKFIFIK